MIPYFDYRPALGRMRPEIDAAVARVLDSGRLILGPELEAFEREFADYISVAHGVGVASGTDALILALRALGVGSGDEVVTAANAGAPPVAAIRAVGAMPRFVDVRPDTLNVDPERVEQAIGARTRAVVGVHLYGQPAEPAALAEICARHDVPFIEDCAQAHGATWGGRRVGGFGRLGCFSFYPTKNLGAFGDGGMVVTEDAGLADRLRRIRMYGYRGGPVSECEGLNSRLDELQAALLRVRLRHLDTENAERAGIARCYREGLAGSVCLPLAVLPEAGPVWHLFVVRCRDRARAIAALGDAGIGHGIHYPRPVHLMEGYGFLGLRTGELPVSEAACEQVLSLPIFPGLTGDEASRVVTALLSLAR